MTRKDIAQKLLELGDEVRGHGNISVSNTMYHLIVLMFQGRECLLEAAAKGLVDDAEKTEARQASAANN